MGFWYIYTYIYSYIYYSFLQGTWWKVSFCKDNWFYSQLTFLFCFYFPILLLHWCLLHFILYVSVYICVSYIHVLPDWWEMKMWMPSLAESWRLFLQLLQKLEVLLFSHFWNGFQQQCSRIMKHTGSISWPADCFISSSVSFFKLL